MRRRGAGHNVMELTVKSATSLTAIGSAVPPAAASTDAAVHQRPTLDTAAYWPPFASSSHPGTSQLGADGLPFGGSPWSAAGASDIGISSLSPGTLAELEALVPGATGDQPAAQQMVQSPAQVVRHMLLSAAKAASAAKSAAQSAAQVAQRMDAHTEMGAATADAVAQRLGPRLDSIEVEATGARTEAKGAHAEAKGAHAEARGAHAEAKGAHSTALGNSQLLRAQNELHENELQAKKQAKREAKVAAAAAEAKRVADEADAEEEREAEERKRKQAKAELRAAENLENAHIVAGLVEEKAAARHTGAQAGRGLEEAVEVYAEAAAVAETKREEAESQLAFVQLQVAGLQQEVAEKEGELAEKEGELHLQQAITKATLEAARPTNHTPRADYTLPVSLTVAKIKPPSRKPAAPTLRALTLTLALFSESCSVRSLGLKRGRRSMSG